MARQALTCRPLYKFAGTASETSAGDTLTQRPRSDVGWITGRTVDETGQPLPYAHVRIDLYGFDTISDATGYFTLTCIPEGEYMVIIEHESYELQFVPNVRVGRGSTSIEAVRMEERILPYQEHLQYREYLE